MKNILLLCESYDGGVKTYIDTIIGNEKSFLNYKFKVLVSSKRLDNKKIINKDFLVDDNLSFGKSLLNLIKALKRLHYEVKINNIDIVHANSTFSGFLIYLYSFLNHNVSFIYTPHGYYSFKSMNKFKKIFIRYIEKKINKVCRKVIHVSHSEESQAIKQQIITKKKSVVIFNGVIDPHININKKKLEKKFTIVNLARVDEQKNPFEFIEVAKYILKKNEDVLFIWAGRGKYLEAAKRQVQKDKLENQIKFIGFSDDKSEILSQANLYFSTSYYEGLPFSVVEAMSYKLPVVLSDVVGHKELVQENGVLYPLTNIEYVSNYIDTLILKKDLLKELSEQSYSLYKNLFSINIMMKKLNNVYNSVAE
ncbi:glycosyltransferase [Niallia sp. 03190]|uniref:glycosyltransferase n=1 Tax=Niallia sp. 03190 TaxID=3458061 RepID=UPI004043F3A7